MKDYQQRENPGASVAIVCPYFFFVHVYKGILEHFPDAEFVLDFTSPPAGETFSEDAKDQLRAWISTQDVPWRDIELTNLTPEEFFSKYNSILAPYYGGWVAHSALQNHTKINVFYGVSKDLWGFSLANAHFDVICTPGPYFTNTLVDLYGKYGIKVVSTGEPKLDNLASLTKEDAQVQLSIKTVKPMLLVTSTWGILSSLSKIAPALISMTDEYEVVLKAHHMVTSFDSQALDIFEGTPVRIIDQTAPITTAIRAADVVVSDSSSSIFDALLANTPVVIVDITGKDPSFFTNTAFYGSKDSKFVGVATRPESLEQIIKKEEWRIGPVIDAAERNVHPSELARAVETSMLHPQRYAPARQHLIETYFLPIDGNAAKRVAETLYNTTRKTTVEEKSFEAKLFLSLIDDYKRRVEQEIQTVYEKEMEGKLEKASEHADKIANIKNLPWRERMVVVMNEFFN